jgi:glycosyltransferase involved in cell wall biosynthesis
VLDVCLWIEDVPEGGLRGPSSSAAAPRGLGAAATGLGRAREIAAGLPALRFAIARVGPDRPRPALPLLPENVEGFRDVVSGSETKPAATRPARVHHAIGAGEAAVLAARAARRDRAPLVLSLGHAPATEAAPFGVRFGDATVALVDTEFARQRAIALGSPPERTRVLPPGVDADRLGFHRLERRAPEERTRALVALYTPLLPAYDAKTFLRAAKLLLERVDLVEIAVVGRTDADEDYVRECRQLAQLLGIDRIARFIGALAPEQVLPHVDCLVFAAEGGPEPQAVLEALAAGVPVVAADEGAAREILEGLPGEDRAIGPAGLVAPGGDHEAFAAAIARILGDRDLRQKLTRAGEARVERFYRKDDRTAELGALYGALAGHPRA